MERYCTCILVKTAPFPSPATGAGKVWQLLRSIWLRELQALEEGKAMKQWATPSHLSAAFGV